MTILRQIVEFHIVNFLVAIVKVAGRNCQIHSRHCQIQNMKKQKIKHSFLE